MAFWQVKLLILRSADALITAVFAGGPKSHGDELIVRTSLFFAKPE